MGAAQQHNNSREQQRRKKEKKFKNIEKLVKQKKLKHGEDR